MSNMFPKHWHWLNKQMAHPQTHAIGRASVAISAGRDVKSNRAMLSSIFFCTLQGNQPEKGIFMYNKIMRYF